MRIYADTSFLVELLCRGAMHHASARQFFLAQGEAEWITTEWTLFETANALRQLCLQSPGLKPEQAEALRRLFKRWHTHGNFIQDTPRADQAIREAMQMSVAHATKLRMRSADVLHVACLEQIDHDLFVTRDKEQHALAVARAFKSHLLP